MESLDYRLGGAADEPPVTFLHGFTQRKESWDELIGLLPAQQCWLTVDLPGHGSSPPELATMSLAGRAVVALWDQLGIERSHLVGYSLGGRLALWIAAHYPSRVQSLTAISSHAGLPELSRPMRRQEDQALADEIEARGVEWFAAKWAELPIFAGLKLREPEFIAMLQKLRLSNSATGLAASLRGMGGGTTEPFWDRLGEIEAPTLLLAGTLDAPYIAYAEELARSIPRAIVQIVNRAGHVVHLEQPERTAELLAVHLSKR
ncbi:MAG: alpha/beta fold hydrolase [Candidatus Dormibacteraceae bacterium]